MIWSGQRPAWVAASTPTGTPTMIPISVASVASSSVAGKKRLMSSSTGRAVSTDCPRSPLSTSPT
jgi:hypothetical protein